MNINHEHTEQIPKEQLAIYQQAAQEAGNVAIQLAGTTTNDSKFWAYTHNWINGERSPLEMPAHQANLKPGYLAVKISADYNEKSGKPFYDKIRELKEQAK